MGGKLDETVFIYKILISHFKKKLLKRSCKKKTSKERNVWRQTQMSKCAQMCIQNFPRSLKNNQSGNFFVLLHRTHDPDPFVKVLTYHTLHYTVNTYGSLYIFHNFIYMQMQAYLKLRDLKKKLIICNLYSPQLSLVKMSEVLSKLKEHKMKSGFLLNFEQFFAACNTRACPSQNGAGNEAFTSSQIHAAGS